MQKKRLLKLADFLETVPRKALELGSWQSREATKPEGEVPGECGFAGCAVGWAAHAKIVPGLSLKSRKPLSWWWQPYFKPKNSRRGVYGVDAVLAAFGIGECDVDHLFMPSHYHEFGCHPTPKQVAKRIRKFVESGEIV